MHSMHVCSGSICVCIFYTVYICYACVYILVNIHLNMCVCMYYCVYLYSLIFYVDHNYVKLYLFYGEK